VKLEAVAGYCKSKQASPQTHYTPAPAQGSVAHHPYTDTIAHIGDTLEAGLSTDCGLSSLWVTLQVVVVVVK